MPPLTLTELVKLRARPSVPPRPPALVLPSSERKRGDGKGYDKPPLSIKGRGGGAGGERGAAARGANPHTCGANPHTKRREEPIKAPARRGLPQGNPPGKGATARGEGAIRGEVLQIGVETAPPIECRRVRAL